MERNMRWGLVCVACLATAGCAGTHYADYAATDAEADSETDGIRYYESAPFVLVHTNGKGGLAASFVRLPDTTRIRVVDPYAVLAKNNATYTFTDGILTSAKNVVDETVIPVKLIEAAKAMALARAGAAAEDGSLEEGAVVPPPALFRVSVGTDGRVRLRGGYGRDARDKYRDVNITVSEPPKEKAEEE